MAMRNSELSFRIRTLEDNNAVLREQKLSLVSQVQYIRTALSMHVMLSAGKKYWLCS